MSLRTLVRYALFFMLGYSLSVFLIQASGVDKVISHRFGRPVQHVESKSPPEIDGHQSFPQHAQRRGKNHDRIREAFLPVSEHARQSTVTLIKEDRVVALGTVVDAQGWIVTKSSEIKDDRYDCLLPNGVRVTAQRAAVNHDHDLALLRLSSNAGIEVAPWREGDDEVPVGSLVFATSGAVTPLAIGVVSVPLIDIPRQPGVLGIRMGQGRTGPIVTAILPGGAASESELEVRDIIMSVNRSRVHTIRQLGDTIREHWPGDEIELVVERDKKEKAIRVRLGREVDLDLENRDFQHELGGPLSNRRSGFGQVVQHDMVTTPDQCGGPLVDVEGRVIGVNIARAERVATYALPAQVVQQVAESLISQAESTIPAKTVEPKANEPESGESESGESESGEPNEPSLPAPTQR